MMVVVMVVMRFWCRGSGGCSPSFRFLICKCIAARRRQTACGWAILFRRKSKFRLSHMADRDPAHPAELVASSIAVSTNAANDRAGIARAFLCRVIRRLFRIRFGSQTLRGFERRRQSVRTRLGTVHLRLQAAVQAFQFGVTDPRLGRQIGSSRISLGFVHESNHPVAGAILA